MEAELKINYTALLSSYWKKIKGTIVLGSRYRIHLMPFLLKLSQKVVKDDLNGGQYIMFFYLDVCTIERKSPIKVAIF